MSDNSDGFDFFASISTVELHRSDKSFDDGTEGFPELFNLISSGGVWDKYLGSGGFAGNVIDEAGVFDLNIVVGPFGEEFGGIFE